MATYEYYINLNERDTFSADVRDSNGKTVWEIHVEADSLADEMEGLPMEHPDDVVGLLEHLIEIEAVPPHSKLVRANGLR